MVDPTAAPFIPGGAAAAAAPPPSSVSVSAQPFVPTNTAKPRASSTLNQAAVSAPPFIRAGAATTGAAGTGMGLNQAAAAMPFVPASSRQPTAEAAPFVPQAQPPTNQVQQHVPVQPRPVLTEPSVPAGPPLGEVAQVPAATQHFGGGRVKNSAVGFGAPYAPHHPSDHHHHHQRHHSHAPHEKNNAPRPTPLSERFVDEAVRQEGHFKHLLSAGYVPPRPGHPPPDAEAPGVTPLPEFLGMYHSLGRLDADPSSQAVHAAAAMQAGSQFTGVTSTAYSGFATECMRAVSNVDGSSACIRVVAHSEPAVAIPAVARAARRWEKHKNHPCMSPVLSAFSAHEYGGHALLCVVCAYHPLSVSLHESLAAPGNTVGVRRKLGEDATWRFACQLLSLIADVHANGLYFSPSDLHATKLLVDGSRVRVGGVGLGLALGLDAAQAETARNPTSVLARQKGDLLHLASALAMAASGAHVSDPIELCLAELSGPGGGVTPELIAFLRALAAPAAGGGFSTAAEALSRIGGRLARELVAAEVRYDRSMTNLGVELDNGRMARLLVKLCIVVDHQGLPGGGGRWGETGDRYVLKLLHDFIFHQAQPDTGLPLLDWGHVAESLNKLDAGLEEEVTLMSRDGGTLLVVSFAELKRALLSAYAELSGMRM